MTAAVGPHGRPAVDAPGGDESFRLRPLRTGDLGRVLELEQVLFGPGAWSRGTYESELANPARRYAAVVTARPGAGERLVGYAGVNLGDDAEVMTVGVDPAHRRRGLARRLMTDLATEARRAGCARLLLEVRAGDHGAQALYTRLGYVAIGRRAGYYAAEGEDAIVMSRDVFEDEAARIRAAVLLTATDLRDALGGARPPAVLDVRWTLARPDGREPFAAGHVPGSVYVDLETDLADRDGAQAGGRGRHPLPDPAALQAAARRWGVRGGQEVVVLDDSGGLAAARAWWLLRRAGLTGVRILDGGLGAWRAAGLPLDRGTSGVAGGPSGPGDVVLPLADGAPPAMPTVDIDEAGAAAARGALLDVRAAERYLGRAEPVDPRAGHVPGARNAPTAALVGAAGTFRDPEGLRAHFAAHGVVLPGPGAGEPWTVSCGSGVTAAHTVAALASLGIPARLWPGSWSQWSADPGRPVATG